MAVAKKLCTAVKKILNPLFYQILPESSYIYASKMQH